MGTTAGKNITISIRDEHGGEVRRIPGGTFAKLYSKRRPINPGSADPLFGSQDWLTDVLVADTQAKLDALQPTQTAFALTSTSSRLVNLEDHIGNHRGRHERCLTICSSLDPTTPTVADEIAVLPEATQMDHNHPLYGQWLMGTPSVRAAVRQANPSATASNSRIAASNYRVTNGAPSDLNLSEVEIYRAHRGKQLVEARFAAAPKGYEVAAAAPSFTIEVRFLGGLSDSQKTAFKRAADRWSAVIVGHLPQVMVDGEVVQDLVILAQGAAIDGVGNILGQAGPTHLRPGNAGKAAFLPAKGEMTFDTADLQDLEQKGTLNDVITHEMGHVLGIGTVWTFKHLLQGAGTADPRFTGPATMKEYSKLVADGSGPRPVPVENQGGAGTRDSHWRELVFGNELMTGFVSGPPNPLSRMTVASLQDLGYEVDLGKAEDYKLPTAHLLAESGAMAASATAGHGIVLPRIPRTLPEESLQVVG